MKTMIIKPRCMGKTTDIIEEVRAHGGILIVHNHREATRLRGIYPDLENKIFGFIEAKQKKFGVVTKIYVDNADYILQEIFDGRVEGISMTIGE